MQIAAALTAKEGNVQKAYEAMVNAGLLTSQKSLLTAAQFKDNMIKALSTQMSQAEAETKTNEIITSMRL